MKTRKLVSLVLAIVTVLGCMIVTAVAGVGGVYYLYPEYNKTDGTFYENCSSDINEWKEGLCEDYYQVTSDDMTWGETGETMWYVATGKIEIANTVTIKGDVRLILCDGAELTITGSTGAGIDNYGDGNSLTIYAQSTGSAMGKLKGTGGIDNSIPDCVQCCAGIRSAGGATLTINGGDVTAYGSTYSGIASAGIGGNSGEEGSNITINGGKVTADNAGNTSLAAGIGGGTDGNGEYITINGGTVIAGNETFYGAGIGGGHNNYPGQKQTGSGMYITINGGNVTAKSNGGSGIGSGWSGYTASYITINGGIVYALGVVGIGGSVNSAYGADFISAHDIVISGGTVTASVISGNGAAIGGLGSFVEDSEHFDSSGDYLSKAIPAKVYNITISGSGTTVTAKAASKGAGIGGGIFCSAENITIKDGATVIATGGSSAAGIGGGGDAEATNADVGYFSNADNITISGEGTTVIATGGQYGAGVGAGQYGNATNITITEGAKVYATTKDGCAIGAGSKGSANGITISNGAEVIAVALNEDAAIGARYNASNITIDNATITAKSGVGGTAIGSVKKEATNITIKGEDTVVTAISSAGASNSGSAIGAGEEGSATGIYVDSSLLMVQNDDETLTDDMEICKDRTIAEDVSATVCNKNMHVIVIKPRDAYVAQVGSGDNVTKYYFVQTAIEKTIKELSYLSKVGDKYYIDETASANLSDGDSVKLDDISITMIADSSEVVDIGSKTAYIYDEWEYAFGMKAYLCQNITLDLNGHVLRAFFDCGESAVTIGEKQTLTLIDSSPDDEHEFTVDDNGLYYWDEVFTSQVSSRLKTDEDGNFFWDDEAAIVTVKGGCITGAARGQFYSASTLWTIAGVYNEGTFNMFAGAITGNGGDDGGVYNSGTMTVGGRAVVEGNMDCSTGTAQNVYLASGTKITIDSLVEGANIGVTTQTKPTEGSPVSFTTNGAKSDEAYFFSDSLDYADKFYNEGTCLDLILGYRVTVQDCEGGTISVGNQKSAYDGETIKVKVIPDEGYALDTLAFSGKGIIATSITDKKSFMMPDKEVVITGTFNQADYALSGSATITDGAVTFKKGDDTVTTAKFGEEITVTIKEVTGYTVTLSSDDVTITDGKFTMPAKAVTITATYSKNQEPGDDNSVYLDLEEDEAYADNHSFEQKYAFKQVSENYIDVTKVKIEWTISDIAATYKSHKTWDPDTLTWVEVKEDVSASDQTATFKFTNYSSTDVKVNVAFVVEEEVKDTYDQTNSKFDNNDCTVKTPVVQDTTTTYTEANFTEKTQTITATLVFKKDEFLELDATTQTTKYGTYTVTIVKP